MTMIVCQHCQAKNEEGVERCVACGEPLIVAAEGREAPKEKPAERDEVDQWVRQLPEFGLLDSEKLAHDDDSLPAWLTAMRAKADTLSKEESNELLDFLADLEPADADLEGAPPEDEVAAKAKVTAELPDWVAELMPDESWPESDDDEALADQFAEAAELDEEQLPSTGRLPQTRPLGDSAELEGIPELLAADALPDWLADQPQNVYEPAEEEPPGWPGKAAGMAAASRVAAQEPAESSQSEPSLDTIDSVLDEISASAFESETGELPAERAPKAEEPSDVADLREWMDPEQTAALEATLEEMLDLPEAESSEERVDQWLDILEGLPGGPESPAPDDEDEAALQPGEVPDWMESLQPEGVLDGPEEGPAEESGPLAGLRGIVPAATLSLAGGVDRHAARLEMTKEQRQQAALLRRLTSAAPEAATVSEAPASDSFMTVRIIVALALVLVIGLGLLVPGVADLLPQPAEPDLPAAAVQAHEAVAASAGETALVAFDYTPSMSGELDPVAHALLADLAASDVSVLAVSQIAAGLPLAEQALAEVDDLTAQSAGYLPGEASGLRALGGCLDLGCDTLGGRPVSSDTRAALADVSLIVVLAADRDSLAGWIEQVGIQTDIPIIGGVTQALGPVAKPYVQSQQLAGLVQGLPESVAYAEATSAVAAVEAEQLTGLTLAQWLAIAVLIVGVIYFGVAAPAASTVSQVAKK